MRSSNFTRPAALAALALLLIAPEAMAQSAAPEASGEPAATAATAGSAVASPTQRLLRQSVAEMSALNEAGRRLEAIAIAERAARQIAEQAGPDHPDTALALSNLGSIQRLAGQTGEAAVSLQRALSIEVGLGSPARPTYRRALRELAEVEKSRGRLPAAIGLYDAALKVLRRETRGSLVEADLLEEQGLLLRHAAEYDKAEGALRTALAIKQASLQENDIGLMQPLNKLAGITRITGKFVDSEAFYKRAIQVATLHKGADDPNVGILVDNLGVLYQQLERQTEAEALHQRALTIFEAKFGPDHLTTVQAVANLAASYLSQERYTEAQQLGERAVEIYRRTVKKDDWRLGFALDNLAGIYRHQGRYSDAARGYQAAIETLRVAFSDEHPDVAIALSNLSLMQFELGRLGDAEQAATKALGIAERAHGPEHLAVASVLNNLGLIQQRAGRPAEARKAYERSVAIIEARLGAQSTRLVLPLSELGGILIELGDAQGAVENARRAARLELKRIERERDDRREDGRRPRTGPFTGLIDALWAANAKDGAVDHEVAKEALEEAQWAMLSRTGAAITKLGARLGSGDGALAGIIRERQDLSRSWNATDKKLTEIMAAGAAAEGRVGRARAELADIEARMAALDERIVKRYPDYADLAAPRSVSIKEIRALLGRRDALLAYLVTDQHTYAWLITSRKAELRRIDIGRARLRDQVRALRCGLDVNEWIGEERPARCLALLKRGPEGEVLPFDSAIAATLYSQLIGSFEKTLKNRHLFIAAHDVLSSLPFQVLIADTKPADSYADTSWLGLSNAMTVLPSVASLQTLRRHAKASGAAKPYFGIGNPVLTGPYDQLSYSWGAQSCLIARLQKTPLPPPPKVALLPPGSYFRGNLANVAAVRGLTPLPETRDELCSVSRSLGASEADLALGSRASETTLRQMNARGALKTYRVVHFATHGLVAGEIAGTAEPSLVLTPPAKATEEDDGLLTASEVATLDLDADWVILSACNTAANDGTGAEALSGLARSFFYAGARSLLVSHWPVESQAAVSLTTRLLREMSTGNGIGRAEALRRSMAALVRENEPNAHPQIWAPFFVVGDGARGSRPAQPREGTAQPATSAGVSQPQQTLPPAAAVSVPPVPSRRPANSALPPAAATVPPAVAQTGSLPVDPAGEANPAQSSAPATAPAISLPFGIKIPLPASGPTALPSGQPDPFKVD